MRRGADALRFYVLVGAANLAVGLMLLVVNIPVLWPSAMVARSVPIVIAPRPAPVAIKQGTPVQVAIPSLGINLPVGVGTYDASNDTWNVDDTKAYYADMSVPINDHNGTTLIYGHAQSSVFATLPTIQAGSEAIVTTDSGYVFHYRYASMREVAPTDMSVFSEDGPPTLVLQTCMGSWSQYRGMFSFTFESVEKA